MTIPERHVANEVFQELLSDFLDESSQLLDRLNERLLTLEELVREADAPTTPCCDREFLNDMFRAAHSLKGLSAMLGLGEINALTHRVENVFDAARNGELRITASVVDTMFRSIDRLVGMVESLRRPGEAMPSGEDLASEIGELLALCREASPPSPPAADAEGTGEFVDGGHDARAAGCAPAAEAASPPEELPRDTEAFLDDVTQEDEPAAKYLAIFIDETGLALDAIDEALSRECAASKDDARSMLVQAHKIKGSASAIGLGRVAKVAHLMEDLLEAASTVQSGLTEEAVAALSSGVDTLRRCLAALQQGQYRQFDLSSAASCLMNARATARLAAAPPRGSLPSRDACRESGPLPEPSDSMPGPEVRSRMHAACAGAESAWAGRVVFTAGYPVSALKAELLIEKLRQLGEVRAHWPELESWGVDRCLPELAFALVSDAAEEMLRAELNVAGVERVELERVLPGTAAPTPETGVEPAAFVTAGRGEARAEADHPPEGTAPLPRGGSGGDTAAKPAETLRVDIERLDQLMKLAGQLVINRARLSRIGDMLKQAALTNPLGTQASAAMELAGAMADWLERPSQATLQGPHREFLRGWTRQLQSRLGAIQMEMRQFSEARGAIQELGEAVHQLQRVSDGIQKGVMDTRMVPIGPLFQRFKRVIRDITRDNGKEIRLVIKGEKTELDKRMIDELGDPLIHMVRNAADHGIESPEERERCGKGRSGTVTLDAFHRGKCVTIQISDDGKGIDPARIKAKALERGMLSAVDAEKMSDRQVLQLIWEPGFSTAEKITHISGRGMGMDIVRQKVEELNGKVELDSVVGQGTVFTIKLPLTLAILPCLLAEVGEQVIALPIESVVEIVSVSRPLETVRGAPVAIVRERVVSVVELHEVLQWSCDDGSESRASGPAATLVILSDGGREIALTVDRLLGEEDVVIKSLAENYRNLAGISGACILGDGRVSLILDPAAIVAMATRGQEANVT